MGCGGNRRRHVAAAVSDDERFSGASAADVAYLGEHDRMGAERLEYADRGARWRQRPASRLDSTPAGRPTNARPTGVVYQIREQLAKEGHPYEGEPTSYIAKGTPSIFLISQNTGHSTSPKVRQRLDAFLKEWTDRGCGRPIMSDS